MLLILDNCEHVIHSSAQLVHQLLRACSRLHIVCTSREAFGITGELVWPVPPLRLPTGELLNGPQDVANAEAVRLFVQRARTTAPEFQLTQLNAGVVAEICRKLEGLPLGIELAAALVKLLSVDKIAERLADPFRLLTRGSRTAPQRHQTLLRALDWSYELLSDTEKVLLGIRRKSCPVLAWWTAVYALAPVGGVRAGQFQNSAAMVH
ncbi:MAG: hypothetical protein JOZ81_02995 [Chloroflexi bacterium]|nr:hypothetical protein [Chloroflexota bacterium]